MEPVTLVGYVGESADGKVRVFLAENAHHYVDLDPQAVVSDSAVEATQAPASLRAVVVAADATRRDGWLDDQGFEATFYQEDAHSGRLAASAFPTGGHPQSWFHPTGYEACYTVSYC